MRVSLLLFSFFLGTAQAQLAGQVKLEPLD